MILDRWMTRLVYSGILEERFQRLHLIANYSILALTLVAYLVLSLPERVITLGAAPGAIIFMISVLAFSYRRAIEGNALDFSALLP